MLPRCSPFPSTDNKVIISLLNPFHFFPFFVCTFSMSICSWACEHGTRTGLHWVHGAPIPALEGACHADAGWACAVFNVRGSKMSSMSSTFCSTIGVTVTVESWWLDWLNSPSSPSSVGGERHPDFSIIQHVYLLLDHFGSFGFVRLWSLWQWNYQIFICGGSPLCRGDVGRALGNTACATNVSNVKMIVHLAGVRCCWSTDCASPDLRLSWSCGKRFSCSTPVRNRICIHVAHRGKRKQHTQTASIWGFASSRFANYGRLNICSAGNMSPGSFIPATSTIASQWLSRS